MPTNFNHNIAKILNNCADNIASLTLEEFAAEFGCPTANDPNMLKIFLESTKDWNKKIAVTSNLLEWLGFSDSDVAKRWFNLKRLLGRNKIPYTEINKEDPAFELYPELVDESKTMSAEALIKYTWILITLENFAKAVKKLRTYCGKYADNYIKDATNLCMYYSDYLKEFNTKKTEQTEDNKLYQHEEKYAKENNQRDQNLRILRRDCAPESDNVFGIFVKDFTATDEYRVKIYCTTEKRLNSEFNKYKLSNPNAHKILELKDPNPANLLIRFKEIYNNKYNFFYKTFVCHNLDELVSDATNLSKEKGDLFNGFPLETTTVNHAADTEIRPRTAIDDSFHTGNRLNITEYVQSVDHAADTRLARIIYNSLYDDDELIAVTADALESIYPNHSSSVNQRSEFAQFLKDKEIPYQTIKKSNPNFHLYPDLVKEAKNIPINAANRREWILMNPKDYSTILYKNGDRSILKIKGIIVNYIFYQSEFNTFELTNKNKIEMNKLTEINNQKIVLYNETLERLFPNYVPRPKCNSKLYYLTLVKMAPDYVPADNEYTANCSFIVVRTRCDLFNKALTRIRKLGNGSNAGAEITYQIQTPNPKEELLKIQREYTWLKLIKGVGLSNKYDSIQIVGIFEINRI